MPSQQQKRYSIVIPFRGRPEIEYYVDKYVHAYLLAKKLKNFGNRVKIVDNKTQKVYQI